MIGSTLCNKNSAAKKNKNTKPQTGTKLPQGHNSGERRSKTTPSLSSFLMEPQQSKNVQKRTKATTEFHNETKPEKKEMIR